MRRLLVASFAAAALTISAPSAAIAQGCTSGQPEANDACAIGRDMLLYTAPLLGTSLAGGSHTLGIGTNLGGFPHFAIAVRANAVMGSRPVIDNISAGPATSKDFETEDQIIGLPTVDFALGLTKGWNLGITRIGGIDLIGGATYVPEISEEDFSIAAPGGSLAIGLGARVGLLQQTALLPGVSVSYMRRNMPTLDLTATTDGGDNLALTNLSVKTSSWRISAQKNLFLLQLGAGFGKDSYDFGADVSATVNDGGSFNGNFSANQAMERTTMYGTVALNLFLIKIVGEVGQVSGGNAPTFNNFSTPADASRNYGTIGIRINF